MERIESQIGGVRDGPLPTSCYDEQSEHEVTRGGCWVGSEPSLPPGLTRGSRPGDVA